MHNRQVYLKVGQDIVGSAMTGINGWRQTVASLTTL